MSIYFLEDRYIHIYNSLQPRECLYCICMTIYHHRNVAFANIYVYTELHAHVLVSHVIVYTWRLKHSKSTTLLRNLCVELALQLADFGIGFEMFQPLVFASSQHGVVGSWFRKAISPSQPILGTSVDLDSKIPRTGFD